MMFSRRGLPAVAEGAPGAALVQKHVRRMGVSHATDQGTLDAIVSGAVERARRMSPADKLLAGIHFSTDLPIMADGSAASFPMPTSTASQEILCERLALSAAKGGPRMNPRGSHDRGHRRAGRAANPVHARWLVVQQLLRDSAGHQDVDFVVQLEPGAIVWLAIRLLGISAGPSDVVRVGDPTSRFVLELADDPFTIELFLLSDDDHDQQRFARAGESQSLDGDVSIPTAEDVMITKLRWSHAGRRRKDFEDAQTLWPSRATGSTGTT